MRRLSIALAASIMSLAGAAAEEDYESWPLLQNPFESTGGGGIMIGGYEPVVTGATCVTDFTATEPNGAVHHNSVAFDAVPAQGGILCTNGAWRARDGSVSGTTPAPGLHQERRRAAIALRRRVAARRRSSGAIDTAGPGR